MASNLFYICIVIASSTVNAIELNCVDEVTTATPTSAPSFEPCTESLTSMSIGFVIDESGSVKAENYGLLINFVIDLMQSSINSVSKVAAMAYGNHNDAIYGFDDDQTDRVELIASLLEEASDYDSGFTDTYNAIIAGLDMFSSSTTLSDDNDKLLFLITDGEPMCNPFLDSIDTDCSEDVCSLVPDIIASGITLYIIGISDKFSKDEVSCLVEEDDSKIFLLDDFAIAGFKSVELEIKNSVLCPEIDDDMSCCTVSSVPIAYTPCSLTTAGWNNAGNNGANDLQIDELSGTIQKIKYNNDHIDALCWTEDSSDITYIDFNSNYDENPELSIEIWIHPFSRGSGPEWLMGSDYGRAIIAYDTRWDGISITDGSYPSDSYSSTISYANLNEWTQIVATWSKTHGIATIYKNGGELAGGEEEVRTIINDYVSDKTRIGINGFEHIIGHNFVGCVGKIQITNTILDAEDVQDLYEQSMLCGGGSTRRRRLKSRGRRILADTSSGSSGDSCIKLKMSVELESLIPTNNNPDVGSNIAMIAAGTATTTGSGNIVVLGKVFHADETTTSEPTPQPTEEPNECKDETQVQESYWPSEDMSETVSGTVESDPDVDCGFLIDYTLLTPDSIVMAFELSSVDLAIGSDCHADIPMTAGFYTISDDITGVLASYTLLSESDTSVKTFEFSETIQLLQDTEYHLIFKGVVPVDCTIEDDLSFPSDDGSTRRMLLSSSVPDLQAELLASPNSCVLGKNLATTNSAMAAGIETLCNTGLSTLNTIKNGLFTQHMSQSSMKNFNMFTGSLHVYYANGEIAYDISDFPYTRTGNLISDPCVAIDSDNNRVYSIGGKFTSGAGVVGAVNDITVYGFVFNDAGTEITSGQILSEYSGWGLDTKRYGAMCYFWKYPATGDGYLVVLGGMLDPASEFSSTAANDYYNDIRIYPIDDSIDDLISKRSPNSALTETVTPATGKGGYSCKYKSSVFKWASFSYPTGAPISINYAGQTYPLVLDARPVILSSSPNILFLFGGKTFKESTGYVSKIDLTMVIEGSAVMMNAMEDLTQQVALPMIDVSTVEIDTDNIQECLVIFAGQSYADSAIVPNGVSTENLQLFCNSVLVDTTTSGRRLGDDGDDGVLRMTDFDKEIFAKAKERRRRRRLQDDGNDTVVEETAVFIRSYDYILDDIWYGWNVTFELCYDTNKELGKAEQLYESIVEQNGDDWDDWSATAAGNILDASKAYMEGWSFGFGDVRVLDLDIIDVNYHYTPSPTDEITSHFERRKARNWWTNIEENNDYVWIDEKMNEYE